MPMEALTAFTVSDAVSGLFVPLTIRTTDYSYHV